MMPNCHENHVRMHIKILLHYAKYFFPFNTRLKYDPDIFYDYM